MAKFIPHERMSKLREDARNGDETARKILNMQLEGKDDYSELLESYFAPKPAEPEVKEEEKVETVVTGVEKKDDPRLEKYLSDNGITKDSPDYDDAVKDFYKEINGGEDENTERDNFEDIIKDLMKEESNAIDDYSKAITKVMNMPEFNEKQMRRAIARFEEIRDDETEHFKELGKLLKNEDDGLGGE